MSQFGIKIKNFEAGSIYSYNLGVRDRLDSTDAMLTNSLFNDFLKELGINIYKEKSTRDIVCLEFNYGSRSYDEEVKHLHKRKEEVGEGLLEKNPQITEKELEEKLQKYDFYLKKAKENEDKFDKKTRNELRTIFYTQGVDIKYITYNKRGNITAEEVIHYKMLYRTPGKAKKGTCMFINEIFYEQARNFLYMGIQLPFENSPIVEIGAYSSLITSTIVDRIQIKPEEILIVKDVDSFFKTKVVSVETDENKRCRAVDIDDYELKNTLFDGQALIDVSKCPEWVDGYVLLRQHMFKAAAFKTYIQRFMKDYFGDIYETAKVKDMFGNEHFVKDIKLITTDNALKWLKFDVTYDYWCDWVRKNDSYFGVVKTAHKSKLGDVQRMSYQMVNALDQAIMPQVVQYSMDYIQMLKTDDQTFLDYLYDNQNFSNDFEVLLALVKQNPDFIRSEYFRSRKYKIIETYTLNFKTGRVIQNADNLVIVGAPYAMLLHAVGEDVNKDDTFKIEPDTIQCYTGRFDNNEYLAEFRNPFNSKNNLGYLHNVYNEKFEKYFDFGKLIIAVNMINTDFQDRNNGLTYWAGSTEM